MEYDPVLEEIRLKNLLGDNFLRVERENFELIQNKFSHPDVSSKTVQASKTREVPTSSKASGSKIMPSSQKPAHSVKTSIRPCPHIKPSPQMKQDEIMKKDLHSNIHFLNTTSTLLSTNVKRRILLNDVKNKYTPCAVPLSPPIRFKKEEICSTGHILNNSPSFKSKHDLCIPKGVPKKELIIQNLPSVTIVGEKDNASLSSDKREVHDKSKVRDAFSCNEKKETHDTPLCSVKKEIDDKNNESRSFSSQPVKKDFPRHIHSSASKVTFGNHEDMHSFKSLDFSPLSSNKINPPATEEEVSKLSPKYSEDKEKAHGLDLHISLDSCSTRELISKILQKIPELASQTENSDSNTNTNEFHLSKQINNSCSLSRHTSQEIFDSKSLPRVIKPYTLPARSLTVSSSVQTDPLVTESTSQSDLYDVVKEVVLETLNTMQYSKHICSDTKREHTPQKVDSGIQSEIENDLAIEVPGKGFLLNDDNNMPYRQKSGISKGIQVYIHSDETPEKQHENFHDEYLNSSPKTLDDSSIQNFAKISEKDDSMSCKSIPYNESHKVGLMLEKIYERICQEKEPTESITDVFSNNPIITREVAVQFNPLHTSTKGTWTSEIKTMDISCQYDIPPDADSIKTNADVSVQATSFAENGSDHDYLQVNAYTQYEPKSYLDSVAQTEFLLHSELSATNTSVSSTPVSDSMFMDDLLSEGEIALPWNLRLLSHSDKTCGLNMNNTDSSDVSIKEKDYSLSEGEIHPNIVHYLNLHPNNYIEDNDIHHDYPARHSVDSRIANAAESDNEKYSIQRPYHKNLHLHISSSSLSEGELCSSASLSMGEVSPGFRVSYADPPLKFEDHPSKHSLHSRNMTHCNQSPAFNYAQMADKPSTSLMYLNISENDFQKEHLREEASSQNVAQGVLQTVDEEMQAVSD